MISNDNSRERMHDKRRDTATGVIREHHFVNLLIVQLEKCFV